MRTRRYSESPVMWLFVLSHSSCIVCANKEGSVATALMRRLAWALAVRICDTYPFLKYMSRGMTKPTKSESSLSTWRTIGSLPIHWAHSEESDQTGRMPKLSWVFAGRTLILLVLSCRDSFVKVFRENIHFGTVDGKVSSDTEPNMVLF